MVPAQATERGPAARRPHGADETTAAVASLAERAQACGRRLGMGVDGASRALAAVRPSEFGEGAGKTWAEVASEFAREGAQLMIMQDVDRRCEPIRLVDFVMIRVYAGKDDRRVLMETAQRRGGGQGNSERARLPEARVERRGDAAEARGEVVTRLQRELTQLQEAESDAHPGIRTLHRKARSRGALGAVQTQGPKKELLQAPAGKKFSLVRSAEEDEAIGHAAGKPFRAGASGGKNPGDLMTKYLDRPKLDKFCKKLGYAARAVLALRGGLIRAWGARLGAPGGGRRQKQIDCLRRVLPDHADFAGQDALLPTEGEPLERRPEQRWAPRGLAAAAAVLCAVAALQAHGPGRGHARGAARSPALRDQALFDEAGPLVATTTGLLQGTLESGVACFRGVPFARPPVRFAPPEPVEPWLGVRDAKRMPRTCQTSKEGGSEDCLLLSIFTRAGSLLGDGELQPVVVEFHGGGFVGGGCSKEGTQWFTKLTGGLLVCPQYRLGVFGFFSPSATPPLLGLQDQQLALRWVQQNARAFGGDPDRVLIFGNSAGGASVAAHLVMPSSAGLFTSASLMSPGAHIVWEDLGAPDDWMAPEDILGNSSVLAMNLGCLGPEDLECLRDATMEEVVEAAHFPGSRFAPALPDGESPVKLIREGRWKRVPVMVGSCSCERCGKFKPPPGRDISEREFRTFLLDHGFDQARGAAVGPELIEEWYAGRLREENRSQVAFRVLSDASHACSAKLHADALQYGANPLHSGVWRLYFDLFGSRYGTHGASHGCAMEWIFGNPESSPSWIPKPGESGATSLHVSMVHWLYSLAAFGDPNVGSTSDLRWPEYTAESPQTLIVDEVPTVGITEDTQAKECRHWQRYLGY
ncbi:unnamed protein product [Prorocentrum cordatum]|uniref:Carboxylesterase type B domain-containing protein n=1 Tax=Prorocentrum cordatum TaxID=2364126 RepID=A0ABN9PIU9_9DINO|nr:unnamed protein product [Polarella glacialis]